MKRETLNSNEINAAVLKAQFHLPYLDLYSLFDRVGRNQWKFVRELRKRLKRAQG